MGMTIEDTKTQLIMQKSYALGKDYRALENALDIIRKYQKIQEIIDNWTKPEEIEWQIREVIEDGKID